MATPTSIRRKAVTTRCCERSSLECNEDSVRAGEIHKSIDRAGHPDESIVRVECLPVFLPSHLIQGHVPARCVRNVDVTIVADQSKGYGTAVRIVVSP